MYRLNVVLIGLLTAALFIAGWKIDTPRASFEHTDHMKVECVLCHHDWTRPAGLTSGAPCMGCHQGRPELRRTLQVDFHRLCRSCHQVERPSHPRGALPVARCSQCHVPPHAPATDAS